jgi:hypothetical protein
VISADYRFEVFHLCCGVSDHGIYARREEQLHVEYSAQSVQSAVQSKQLNAYELQRSDSFFNDLWLFLHFWLGSRFWPWPAGPGVCSAENPARVTGVS